MAGATAFFVAIALTVLYVMAYFLSDFILSPSGGVGGWLLRVALPPLVGCLIALLPAVLLARHSRVISLRALIVMLSATAGSFVMLALRAAGYWPHCPYFAAAAPMLCIEALLYFVVLRQRRWLLPPVAPTSPPRRCFDSIEAGMYRRVMHRAMQRKVEHHREFHKYDLTGGAFDVKVG